MTFRENNRDYIVPLKDVSINARVETGLTKTVVKLTYSNRISTSDAEIMYEYPLIKNQVVD